MNDIWQSIRHIVASPAALVILTLGGAAIAGFVVMRILKAIWLRLARRTRAGWDDQLAARLGGPVSLLLAILLFQVSLAWLPLGAAATQALRDAISVITVVTVMWGAFRAIDLAHRMLEERRWAAERPASRSLLALGARFAKVTVLVMGALVALSQVGVSVASLLAGLGIGGLVLALAAQKTVENLFGAVSIGVDQPMREGDFIRIYDFVGTVEQIGLRSTRIRTLDRTLVTIPNGELANQRIESYTARDRIRLACTIGVEYRTTPEQMREILAALRRILREHPRIWPDAIVVRFKEFAESSLDIEIMAWFQTSDWSEFQAIREEVLLEFMAAIAQAGCSMAFPTHTVHLADADTAAAPARGPSRGTATRTTPGRASNDDTSIG